jgi:putative flippase GtrA
MSLEPEFALFVAAGVLTVIVAVVVGVLLRHAFREERQRQEEERK